MFFAHLECNYDLFFTSDASVLEDYDLVKGASKCFTLNNNNNPGISDHVMINVCHDSVNFSCLLN